MIYAADTTTSVEKTRAELESTLQRFGATAFGYASDEGRAAIQFKAADRLVRFTLPVPEKDEARFTKYKHRGGYMLARTAEAARKEWEQACRSAWRALFLAVKAKLVAVEAGIATFEQEFLAYIVLPDGQTAGEAMIPKIAEAYVTGLAPTFTLALPAPRC